MFLIAGVSPKIKILDTNPRICPVCGLVRAYFKRVDHYLYLFFIPVLRIKKGEPFIMCDRCEKTVHEFKEEYGHPAHGKGAMCHDCGKDLDKDFKYCPYCGKQQHK
jgi:RNA polymerase subunit RPABC4/transcription elongation factor Spt4